MARRHLCEARHRGAPGGRPGVGAPRIVSDAARALSLCRERLPEGARLRAEEPVVRAQPRPPPRRRPRPRGRCARMAPGRLRRRRPARARRERGHRGLVRARARTRGKPRGGEGRPRSRDEGGRLARSTKRSSNGWSAALRRPKMQAAPPAPLRATSPCGPPRSACAPRRRQLAEPLPFAAPSTRLSPAGSSAFRSTTSKGPAHGSSRKRPEAARPWQAQSPRRAPRALARLPRRKLPRPEQEALPPQSHMPSFSWTGSR